LVRLEHVFKKKHESKDLVLAAAWDEDLALLLQNGGFDLRFQAFFGDELEVSVAAQVLLLVVLVGIREEVVCMLELVNWE
jgi:hypothetical protein